MMPTLDEALLYSSRAGADLCLESGFFEELFNDAFTIIIMCMLRQVCIIPIDKIDNILIPNLEGA